jgi:Secretion system C-terminal sorting domain
MVNKQLLCETQLGTCVYKARTLNAIFYPAKTYNDFDICAASLPQNKGGKNIYQEDDELINANEGQNFIPILYAKGQLSIYPNPIKINGQLTVEYAIENEGSIEIFDMIGKLVLKLDISKDVDRVTFEMGDLSKGNYTLKVNDGGKMINSCTINVH